MFALTTLRLRPLRSGTSKTLQHPERRLQVLGADRRFLGVKRDRSSDANRKRRRRRRVPTHRHRVAVHAAVGAAPR